MKRPPIETLKKLKFYRRIGEDVIDLDALCNYALELEVKLKEMLWEKIKEAQDAEKV